ncbi:MAG TPA: MFS transporter [Methylomirabilota bacterium]|nr:MFS transporter [Methylomirabilota bacterium]
MTSRRWLILGVCILGFMQTHMHRVGFAPLIPDFISDLGIAYATAGTIMTAYFWTYTAVQVPIGVVTDRFGSRRVMLGFLVVLVAGVVAFTMSRTYTQSLLARCLVGLGTAAVWLPGLRLIQEWFPPSERGRATGLFSAGGGLGGTAALVVIPLLAERFGWRYGYALLLLPLLLTLGLAFLLIGPPATPAHAAAAPRRGVAVASVPGAQRPLGALGRVLQAPEIWPFNLAVLFSYGGYLGLITWLPTFLVQQEGLSRAMAGAVTALMTAGTIVSWPMAGFLSDRLGRRKAIYLVSQGFGALVCLAFALVVPGSGLVVAGTVALISGLVLGGMVTPFVMVTELFPPDLVGTASGVVNTFCFVGGLFVPVALGWIVDVTGSFPAAFVACAVTQALSLGCAAFTRETGLRRAIMAG